MKPSVLQGQPWVLRSEIVKGHQRGGTQLGFPTANLRLNKSITDQLLRFHNTVWAGYCVVEDTVPESEDLNEHAKAIEISRDPIQQQQTATTNQKTKIYPTVFSVGSNPHFKDVDLTVEPYILQKFKEDFYGKTMRLLGVKPMRQMGAYISLDALIDDIKNDCRVGSKILEDENSILLRNALVDPKVFAGSRNQAEFFKFLESHQQQKSAL